MVLLDLLAKLPDIKSIVAHYDHGIRPDSKADRLFVKKMAKAYGLPFVYDQGKLGPKASEAEARVARYSFLEKTRQASGARAVVTAHHQDDQLETAFINTIRGTGRRGITALRNRPTMMRPLLNIPKRELVAHAQSNGLKWREDSTNQDTRYLRNSIRLKILPLLAQTDLDQLTSGLRELSVTNDQIDKLLINHLHTQTTAGQLDRYWFNMLPHMVATEIMSIWLRSHGIANLDKKRIEMLTTKARILPDGKSIVMDSSHSIKVGKRQLALTVAER